jgi:hypothetical protein
MAHLCKNGGGPLVVIGAHTASPSAVYARDTMISCAIHVPHHQDQPVGRISKIADRLSLRDIFDSDPAKKQLGIIV